MEVKSMARVKYSYSVDGVSLTGLSSSNVVTTQIRKKNLLVRKLVNSKYFKPDDVMTYNIILSNMGNVLLSKVTIQDEITSQNLIFDSIEVSSLDSKTKVLNYEVNDSSVVFYLEELNPEEVVIITYKTTIKDNRSYINTTLFVNCEDIEIKEQTNLSLGYANISCTKDVLSDYTYLNTSLTYVLKLKNSGNISAYNVEVYDELPVTYELSEVVINDEKIDYSYEGNVLKFSLNEIKDEVEVYVHGKIVK